MYISNYVNFNKNCYAIKKFIEVEVVYFFERSLINLTVLITCLYDVNNLLNSKNFYVK